MKRLLLSLLIITTMLGVTACSQKDADATASPALTIAPSSGHVNNLPAIEPAPSTEPAAGSTNTIIATAIGEYNVAPDVAYVNIGMTTSGSSAEEVQKINDENMSKVLEAIKNAGIADNEISTSDYSVYPEYNYASTRQTIKGFVAVNRATITINDINNVGKVLQAAHNAGANDIGNISFSIKNRNEAYNAALSGAIQAARSRAQVMADAAGVQLGGLVQVSETSYSTPYVQRSYSNYVGEAEPQAADSTASSISTGELKINANATVVFEIK